MENEELLDFFTLLFCTRVDFPEFFVLHLMTLEQSDADPSPTHYNITKIKAGSMTSSSNHRKKVSPLTELSSEIIQPVSSLKELQNCLRNPKVTLCRLTKTIETTENIVINRDIVIDLGGYEIKSDAKNIRVIDIIKGNVALIGTGSIIASGNGGVAIRIRGSDDSAAEKYSSITVGAEVLLQATSNDFSYGLIVSPNHRAAYGLTVNLYGVIDAYNGIYINGNVIAKKGNIPVVNIDNGAAISVNPDSGTAIYAAGYGVWKIGDATLVGGNGVDIKMGRLVVDGATISTTALSRDSSAGAVMQIEDNDSNATCVDIKIKDGVFTSQNNHIFYEYSNCQARTQSLRRLRISGGNLSAGVGKKIFYGVPEKDTVQICGGRFNDDVLDFLAPRAKLFSSTFRDDNGRMTRVWEVESADNHEAKNSLLKKTKIQESKLALAKTALMSVNEPSEEYHQVEDYAYNDFDIEPENVEPVAQSAEILMFDDTTINQTPVDCTILAEILEAAEDIDQSAYTAESYDTLAEVLESARTVLEHPTLASQEDVDRIVIAVALATTNLIENPRENLQALSLATVRSYAEPHAVAEPIPEETQVIAYPESKQANLYNNYYPTQQFQPMPNPSSTYMGNSNYQTYSPTYNYYNYPAPVEMMYPAWQNNLTPGQPTSYLPANTYYPSPAMASEPTQSYNYNYMYDIPAINYHNHNQVASQKSSTSVYENPVQNYSSQIEPAVNYAPTMPQLSAQFATSAPVATTKQNPPDSYSMSAFSKSQNPSSGAPAYATFSNSPSLDAAIAEAKEISAMDYTLSSFAELQRAIYAAEDIAHDYNATVEEIDAASFNLNYAVSNLEKEVFEDCSQNRNLDFYQYQQPLYY